MKQSQRDELSRIVPPGLTDIFLGSPEDEDYESAQFTDDSLETLTKSLDSTVEKIINREPSKLIVPTVRQEVEFQEFMKDFPAPPSRKPELRKRFMQQALNVKAANRAGWRRGIDALPSSPLKKCLSALDEGDEAEAERHLVDLVSICAGK